MCLRQPCSEIRPRKEKLGGLILGEEGRIVAFLWISGGGKVRYWYLRRGTRVADINLLRRCLRKEVIVGLNNALSRSSMPAERA